MTLPPQLRSSYEIKEKEKINSLTISIRFHQSNNPPSAMPITLRMPSWTSLRAGESKNEMDVDSDDSSDYARDSRPSSYLSPSKLVSTAAPKKLRSALNLYAMMTQAEKVQNPRPIDTRSMRFSATVSICLITPRSEWKAQQTIDSFWRPQDYQNFKHEAVHDLRAFLTAHGITAKEAIFQLYQPHDHERDVWMKEFDESEKEKYNNSCKDGDQTDRETSSNDGTDRSHGSIDDMDRYNSEEDDEPHYGSVGANTFKFFTQVKTDIELNAERETNKGIHGNKGPHMPTKTPNAGVNQGQMWAKKWIPSSSSSSEHKE